ncbi:MAG: hypothetical protein AAGD38_15390, partial [Acidobacteriota bacterium]
DMLTRFVSLLALAALTIPCFAGPSVVPTAEGQIGETPGFDDGVFGSRFESIRGSNGDLLLGGIFVPGGVLPPPPEFQFLTDQIHGTPDPVPVSSSSTAFVETFKTLPGSSRSRNAADDGDFVAFSFAIDGSMPQTMTVRLATYDESGTTNVDMPIVTDAPTFADPVFNRTGVAVDSQGRVTVAYTELGMPPVIRAQRRDATTGVVIDPDFLVATNRGEVDVALLDPAGNRLIVSHTDFVTIRGNIVDFSGGTPVVLPEFTISTTPAVTNNNASVAAHPTTGTSMVVWENFVDTPGDPVNIRGRRFDAMGNPIGGDFIVNTNTANAQGQPAIAMDSNTAATAVVWAGDAIPPQPENLDIFMQVYDADGNPIGGEVTVNTTTAGVQDRPTVRFLPELDTQGRPQVTVVWRDVQNTITNRPNGTGISYKCFSIDGLDEPGPIFADGFESGDTSSWSSVVDN